MIVYAPAKINLGLDVLRRLPDGYHEVDMVMQTIGLSDTVTIERTENEGIFLSCDRPALPCDETNLAYRAAALLFERFPHTGGVTIHIEKHIPIAAGLAGGSTDCAAVLSGMNVLFSFGISDGELAALGKTLGADVPYCLMQGTARAQGIGEKLTRLPAMPKCPVLLVKPKASVSTKAVYEGLRLEEGTKHPDIAGLITAIGTGDLAQIAGKMENLLESVTIPMHGIVGEIKQEMEKNGAVRALMSGSGPTVFGIFLDLETARGAEKAMRNTNMGDQVCLTEIQ